MNSCYGDSIEVCSYQLFYSTKEYLLMNTLILQHYEVLDMLGKGGFAHVFRAISKNNGQEVAIKKVSLVMDN